MAPAGILLLANSLRVGGAERQLVETAIRLDRTRFAVQVIAAEDGALREPLVAGGIPVRTLNRPVPAMSQWYRPDVAWRAVRLVDALTSELASARPRIVQGYLLSTNLYGVLAARRVGGIRFIAGRRSLGDLRRTSGLARRFDRFVNARADCVLVNCRAVWDDVEHHERIAPAKLRLIHNGLDTALYAAAVDRAAVRRDLDLPADAFVIGTIGNLSPWKGHADLIEAISRLGAAGVAATCVIAGEDRGERPQLEALVRQRGLDRQVRFLGLRHDVSRLLHALDVQVQPSHSEAFSNAVIEGLAAGRALVVTRVGGMLEAVEDGESGLTVPPRDPGALAAAIQRLHDDPGLAARLGENARRRAAERFSWERMVSATENLYEELLA